VSHCGGLAIYITKKKYLKAKKRITETQICAYFTMPKYNLQKQKILYLKETQNISSCFKNTHIKIDLLLLLLLLL
jgi:hypothetical protein